MNKENTIIIRIHQALVILRECFDYALHNAKISKKLHSRRDDFFYKFINDPLIPSLLSNNEEVKEKIMRQLNEFYNDVFRDNKCFLYDSDDYYRTDEDFRVPLLEYLVGLYQTLSDMIGSVFNQIKDQSKIDSLVEEVMIYENHYYTSKSLFILFNEVVRLSTELNKLLKEGQKENLKPQVQFFVNELKKLVSLIRFVEGKYKLDKEEIKSIFPVIDNTLKLMDGSIKAEGKEVAAAIRQTLTYLIGLDHIYNLLFNKIFKELITKIQSKQSNQKLDDNIQA
ncbi:TPA: hypothetical protein GXZ54_02825 [bacterium]|nr:hypothetical protein [bacterium]